MTHPIHTTFKFALIALVFTAVSGCMMSAPPSRGENGAQSLMADQSAGLHIRNLSVSVPRTLVVSEENTFKPAADIVWHGDAAGDRYMQVERIVQGAMQAGVAPYRSGPNAAGRLVDVQVQVVRFHALTPKTRVTFGGKHELEYALTLRDAATGEVLRQMPLVKATVRAAGGEKARLEEAAGRTQAVVISEALAASIGAQLSQVASGGAQVSRAGFGRGLMSLVSRAAYAPHQPMLN